MIVSALQADTTAHSTVPADSNYISTIAIDDHKPDEIQQLEMRSSEKSQQHTVAGLSMKRVSAEDQFARER